MQSSFRPAGGHTIERKHIAIIANAPLQKAQTILQKAYYRSYCIAIQAPKGAYKDVLLYDNGDLYVYVRETAYHNSKYEYTAVRTTKLGRRPPRLRKALSALEAWTRAHYPFVEETEFRWSSQIVEPNDYMAFIGKNMGPDRNAYISTGDFGNGPTNGVVAGRVIANSITGCPNSWASLYSPSRTPKL